MGRTNYAHLFLISTQELDLAQRLATAWVLDGLEADFEDGSGVIVSELFVAGIHGRPKELKAFSPNSVVCPGVAL